MTGTQLKAAISDNSLDTILLQPGTYHVGRMDIFAARTRPVVVRPESSGVTFDGDSVAGVQKLFIWFNGAANITLQGVTITDYGPKDTGVIIFTDGAHDITLDGLTMTANRLTGDNDHLIYPAGYSAAGYNLTVKNSLLDGAGGGGCIHVYHPPGPLSVYVTNNQIRNCHWGIINAAEGSVVYATGNTFTGCTVNMLTYKTAYNTELYASGNNPNNNVVLW